MNKYILLVLLCLIISTSCIIYGFVYHNINYSLIAGISTSIGFIILYIYLVKLEKKGVQYVIEF